MTNLLLWLAQVHGLDGIKVVAVACGWRHSIVVDEAGIVYTFGWCKYGQLGHGDARSATQSLLIAYEWMTLVHTAHPSGLRYIF